MIARLWTGVVASPDRDAYVAYMWETGVSAYTRTPGCSLALILTRDVPDDSPAYPRTEVVAFSLWDDEDSMSPFQSTEPLRSSNDDAEIHGKHGGNRA